MSYGKNMNVVHWQNGSLNLTNRMFSSRTSLFSKPQSENPMAAVVKGADKSTWVDTAFARYQGGHGYLADGEIIGVYADSTLGGYHQNVALVLVRLRGTGPLLRVNLIHPITPRANYEPVTAFQGRGDILCAEEAHGYGLRLSGGLIERMADLRAIETLLSLGELAPALVESTGSETVLTEKGEKQVQVLEPVRRMRFRNKQ